MIAADRPQGSAARLLAIDAAGAVRHRPRAGLAGLFEPGDLVVANDAATLPASLAGTHIPTGAPVEVRLAAWLSLDDATRFVAVAFGAGDHRTPTEDRPPPPPIKPGDRLRLGPLVATVERTYGALRLVDLRLSGTGDTVRAGVARHGRPIQYAHVPEPLALWDVWTPLAARPIAFEPPSAGFALDWRTVAAFRARGVGFVTLTHAAGISSTGDPALDALLPFDEPYRIPHATAAAIARTKAAGGRVIAIGTTVVRALESASTADGRVRAGDGVATGRIGQETPLRVADAILTGVHRPGESHYELLRAFASDAALEKLAAEAEAHGYRPHEFGDSMLIERDHTRRLAPVRSPLLSSCHGLTAASIP